MPYRWKKDRADLFNEVIARRDLLNKLIDIGASSSRIESIIFPNGKRFRGNIHIMIYGMFGVGKSAKLYDICEDLKITPIHSISKAHLLGSIDKNTGIPVYPITWNNRRSVIAIDEFHFDSRHDSSMMDILLSLMEFPNFKKHVGYRGNDIDEVDGQLYFKVKNNVINMKTSFSIIMTTMFNPSIVKSQLMRALVSRCIIIPYFPTREEVMSKLRGEIKHKPKIYKVKDEVYKLPKKVYNRILNYIDNKNLKTQFVMRAMGDIARVFAVTRKWDEELFDFVIDLKRLYYLRDESDDLPV